MDKMTIVGSPCYGALIFLLLHFIQASQKLVCLIWCSTSPVNRGGHIWMVSYLTTLLGKPSRGNLPVQSASNWQLALLGSAGEKFFPRKNVPDARVDLRGPLLTKRTHYRPSYHAQYKWENSYICATFRTWRKTTDNKIFLAYFLISSVIFSL